VLASGRGSTFEALLAAQRSGRIAIDVRALLCDRRTAPVLGIAETAGVPTVALRPRDYADRDAFDRALFAEVARFSPELVVLAGYMRLIGSVAVDAWHGRMINLHPSLLPRHPGLDTYARALAAGDAEFGSSVHFVTGELDGGPVISQVVLPVLPGDSPETMTDRLRPAEQALLVETVGLFASARVTLGPQGVVLDGQPLSGPLALGPDGRFHGL
jgi:phosphoribosylglycinamide formyltransferase-1